MFKVMLRPKWIGALLLVFIIATVFVWLSAWQISRAEENAEVVDEDFETLIELIDVQMPNSSATDEAAGHRVTISGIFVKDVPIVVIDRGFSPLSSTNPSEEEKEETGQGGVWLIERFIADISPEYVAESATNPQDSAELAIVSGWAPSIEEALAAWEENAAVGDRVELTGRFFPVEALDRLEQISAFDLDTYFDQNSSDFDTAYSLPRVSPAAFVNLWEGDLNDLRYSGYLINEQSVPGLTVVDSQAPEIEVQWNFLNIFYAVEWIFFAGFAGYIWYRMVRDEYEEEQQALAEQQVE